MCVASVTPLLAFVALSSMLRVLKVASRASAKRRRACNLQNETEIFPCGQTRMSTSRVPTMTARRALRVSCAEPSRLRAAPSSLPELWPVSVVCPSHI